MNVLEALAEGKKVCREAWEADRFWKLLAAANPGEATLVQDGLSRALHQLPLVDLVAQDWREYVEPAVEAVAPFVEAAAPVVAALDPSLAPEAAAAEVVAKAVDRGP